MTDRDIRRAHALWQYLRAAHKDLSEMADGWEREANEPGLMDPYRRGLDECAIKLRCYLARWEKPLEEGEEAAQQVKP